MMTENLGEKSFLLWIKILQVFYKIFSVRPVNSQNFLATSLAGWATFSTSARKLSGPKDIGKQFISCILDHPVQTQRKLHV